MVEGDHDVFGLVDGRSQVASVRYHEPVMVTLATNLVTYLNRLSGL